MEKRNPYELYSVESYMERADLEHHGMKGQRWGVRRYQNPDGSLTPLGQARLARQQKRFIRKTERQQEKERKEAVKQEKIAIKQQKQAAEEEKERLKKEEEILKQKEKIFKSGDAEEMMKNKDLFSDAEISAFVNRKRREQELEQFIPKKDKKDKGSKVDKFVSGVNKAENLFNAYKKGAGIVNALTGTETLPTFDGKRKGISSLYELTADEILGRQSSLTTDELDDLSKRMKSLRSIAGKDDDSDSGGGGSKKSKKSGNNNSGGGGGGNATGVRGDKWEKVETPSSSSSFNVSKGSRYSGNSSYSSSSSSDFNVSKGSRYSGNSRHGQSKRDYTGVKGQTWEKRETSSTPSSSSSSYPQLGYDSSKSFTKYSTYNDPYTPRHTGSQQGFYRPSGSSSSSRSYGQVLEQTSRQSLSSALSSGYPELGTRYTGSQANLPMKDIPQLGMRSTPSLGVKETPQLGMKSTPSLGTRDTPLLSMKDSLALPASDLPSLPMKDSPLLSMQDRYSLPMKDLPRLPYKG